jgi:plasmid stability protein
MAQVLVRGLDEAVVDRLKERARAGGRSLEAELRAVIEGAAAYEAGLQSTRDLAVRLRRRLASRKHTDSAVLIAEDRRR